MLSSPKEEYTKSLWAVRSIEAKAKPTPETAAVPIVRVENVTRGLWCNHSTGKRQF